MCFLFVVIDPYNMLNDVVSVCKRVDIM